MNAKRKRNHSSVVKKESPVASDEPTADDSVYVLPDNHPLIELSDDEDFDVGSKVSTLSKSNTSKPVAHAFGIKKERVGKSPGSPVDCGSKKRKICSVESDFQVDRNAAAKKIKTDYSDAQVIKHEKSDVKNEDKFTSIKTERKTKEVADTASKIKSEKKALKICSVESDFRVDRNAAAKKIKIEDSDTQVIKHEKPDVENEDKLPSIKTERKMKEETETASKIKSEKKAVKSEVKPKLEKLKNAHFLPKSEKGPEMSALSREECRLGSGIEWESFMLAKWAHIDRAIARNIIYMLKNDCTIPFMARYRSEKTNNMDADKLRHVKECYENVKILETKTLNAIKQIKKLDKLTPKLEKCFYSVQSLDELDFLYAPYKKGSSKSKAERARALGLESAAIAVLEGQGPFNVNAYIDQNKEGLQNGEQVIQSVQNIIADMFSKDEDVLNHLHDIEKRVHIIIKSTKVKSAAGKKSSKGEKAKSNDDVDPERKFETYYNFETSVRNIQPHQVLALNRGENLKVLSVKLTVDQWLKDKLCKFCEQKWLFRGFSNPLRVKIFRDSFNDSYDRLISPFVLRRARSELNRKAQNSAIESFALNLKSLLQTPPIKGCPILGIDPGFKHGCKFALISGSGDVLWTDVFHFEVNYMSKSDEKHLSCIKEKLISYKCELVAIGNGTGCRIIEKKIGDCIKNDFFKPDIDVKYTIVNERSASIYSCSPIAKEEFPDLNPNLVSAVYIARSLQDPLNEFVKVEPKHLGVGMYQHDMPEKQLNAALDEIVQQCVSFTGVDVNTASVHLLRRIAGLGENRASNIIEWRRKNGPFINRHQLTLVNQIGPKTFEQCSGFIRIHPQTAPINTDGHSKDDSKKTTSKKQTHTDKPNPLDRTWIHPESYEIAESFIKMCKVDLRELGTVDFIERVKNVVNTEGVARIASQLHQTENTISFIAEALMKPNDYDYRCKFSKPLFRQGVTDINSITPGLVMTGVIGNVTHFGAFVDIGVGKDGLIHSTNANGISVQVGNRVEVKILSVEAQRSRIGLSLLRVLQ